MFISIAKAYFQPTSEPASLLAMPTIENVNNCPPPSRMFCGRQDIMNQMTEYFGQRLEKQQIFLLHGLGGAGKSQIALKFIQESDQFTDIFLIDASTPDTIDIILRDIALSKAENTSQDALRWLRTPHDEWLLLYDNADDPNINLNLFLPQCDHGNIIIASRNPALRVYAGSHTVVSKMEEADAVNLLLKSAAQEITPHSEMLAAAIIQELWGLPLAIIQAGAFIAQSGALNTYLALFQQNQACLLSKKPTQAHDDYGGTVYTTWQISFYRLTVLFSNRVISINMLGLAPATLIGPQQKGRKLAELLSMFKIMMQFSAWSKRPNVDLFFTEVTNELQAYSLIAIDAATERFSMHPLVQSWSRSTLTDEEVDHCSMADLVDISFDTLLEQYKQLAEQYQRISPADIDSRDFLVGVAALAQTHYKRGRLREAEELKVIVLEKDILGSDHPDTLLSMASLAQTYYQLGRLYKAEELQVVVLEKQWQILGEDDPDTLKSMADLGATYYKLGKLSQAEELQVVVLEKQKNILGEDHVETLLTMVHLAATYVQLGKLNKAEELGIDHRHTLTSAGNLAVIYYRLGNHPDTLKSIVELGATYYKLGKLNQAEKLQFVALEKQKNILGKDHLETLLTMVQLAATYVQLGKLNKAEELGIVVLEKQRQILGEDYPHILISAATLAVIYHKLGRLNEAEELEVVVLEKQMNTFGKDHPDTLYTMALLSATRYQIGQSNKVGIMNFIRQKLFQ
ncbi:P-loop containing nucleoside triphosphate hydrolase protein [Mycena galopus ATCC 62051]|nr:P-loop containing nucleoside triphosphate hydrolase protein [Mycena galopus ATCC 62051]